MVRQVGTALGIALIGAIFVAQATSHVRHDLARATDIPPAVRAQVVKGVGDGIGGGAPPGASDTPTGRRISTIVSHSVADAAQPAVAFAGAVVTLGALISLLVPNIPAEHGPPPAGAWAGADGAAGADPESDPEVEPSPA
jgi:drug/metabolite transporter (DMT)-like permease